MNLQDLKEEAREEYKALLEVFNIEDKEPEEYEVKMEAPMLQLLERYIDLTAQATRERDIEVALVSRCQECNLGTYEDGTTCKGCLGTARPANSEVASAIEKL